MTSVKDIIIVTIILFVVGIATTLIVSMSHSINDQLLKVNTFNDSIEARTVIQSADTASNSSDYIYLALFIGFFISVIITGWFIGGYPIAAPIYFFILIIFVFVAVILQMTWADISATSSISTMVADLPITNFILSKLGYFTAAMGLTGILVMYAKPGEQI